MNRFQFYLLISLNLSLACLACNTSQSVKLKSGMKMTRSLTIDSALYTLAALDDLDKPVLLVQGDNMVLDFNGAILDSGMNPSEPNMFKGLGLLIKGGSKITIKNLKIKGYKVALMAQDVDSLQIIDCDFSYNYRPKLYSLWDREDFSDWLSYHQNEDDEWLRYGAGVYLKNCTGTTVSGVRITQNQNGILMTQCQNGLFYNNAIQFNSGVGLGLYRSSHNKVMHNRLDWNVRGYSHAQYQRGQDSAGILCYEQSNDNTFAYNSATHSGDGFFLWAGQTTMDSGEGGCNDNLIYANDFSQAPTNGVEITFSRNLVINNFLEECRYGIWGGYSWDSKIMGNQIVDCNVGIAIEHGQNNLIERNRLHKTETGIQLWEREQQPKEWGYAEAKEVVSRDYRIRENLFSQVPEPLEISATDSVLITGNFFFDVETLLTAKALNPALTMHANKLSKVKSWGAARLFQKDNEILSNREVDTSQVLLGAYGFMPPPLLDGVDAILPEDHPRGRQYILMNEWGPYNFEYPSIWLREIKEEEYVFLLMGPAGNWKAVGGEGLANINPKTGTFPATFKARKLPEAESITIDFQFIGDGFTNQFGEAIKKGGGHVFSFSRYEKRLNWQVSWYAYDDATDPTSNPTEFRQMRNESPLAEAEANHLVYHWWGSPAEGVPEDRFATFASSTVTLEEGLYNIAISSDDGLRLYIDDKLVLDHWEPHEPAMKEIQISLGGQHSFLIEHYDQSGLSAVDFRIQPLPDDTL